MSEKITRLQQRIVAVLPNIQALVWGIFAAVTSAAYMTNVPIQLQEVDAFLPFHLWAWWCLAACLLIIGSLVPPSASPLALMWAKQARLAGISIVAGLLVLWSVMFFNYHARGWVSGKNYVMLAVLATLGSWTVSKDQTKQG